MENIPPDPDFDNAFTGTIQMLTASHRPDGKWDVRNADRKVQGGLTTEVKSENACLVTEPGQIGVTGSVWTVTGTPSGTYDGVSARIYAGITRWDFYNGLFLDPQPVTESAELVFDPPVQVKFADV